MSTADRAKSLIREDIQALTAYHVPDPGDLIKLDAMENPYPWPPELVEDWLKLLRDVSINRYPDPDARIVKDRLREAMAIPGHADILLGNGSDEIIQMILLALAGTDENGKRRVALAPEPTFVMYSMLATVCGMDFYGVPLNEDFSLDMPAMRQAIAEHQPAVIFLAYPNNPTGNLFDAEQVDEIIRAAPGIVILDEAYTAFTDASFMDRLDDYDNMLVMRTVSKIGLAGLRLGLLAGATEWLTEIGKTRLPYNINILTQVSADFALSNKGVFDEQAAQIRRDREELLTQIRSLNGLVVYPSETNFVLFRVPEGRGREIFEGLKERGVLIKNLGAAGGVLGDCLRVTVGSGGENGRFLTGLRAVL